MQNDGEDGEQPIDVGLGKVYWPRSSAVLGKTIALQIIWFDLIVTFVVLLPKKEHVLAIFFALEKAYDTTWKHSILSDLYDLDFRGHLPTFIDGFLSHRLFRMRAGSTLSDMYEQEMGVRQDSTCLRFFSVFELTILSSQS